jgi:HlyD family secretion protein
MFARQLKTTLIEQKSSEYVTENAATKRQVDEVEGKVNVLKEQMKV